MSTPPEKTPGRTPQECPWATHPATGEHERLAPPAPMIELDTPSQDAPVKPLGPRRLARLQREMAEHTREIQNSERTGGAPVDEALLATQQRLAELAVRAAAANERDRRDAQRALAADTGPGPVDGHTSSGVGPSAETPAPQTSAAGATSPRTDGADTRAGGAPERITVTIPGRQSTAADGVILSSGEVDPGTWPAMADGPGLETTQIPIYVAPTNGETPGRAEHGAAVAAEIAETRETRDHRSAALVTGTAADDADAANHHTAAAPIPPEPRAGEAPAGTAASSADDAFQAPPGVPVRAEDAQGLDLLGPGSYHRGTGVRWLIVLLLALVVALAVVLVMFVL